MEFYLYSPIYLHGVDRHSVTSSQIIQSYVKYVRGNEGVASASQVVSYTVLLILATRCYLVFNNLLNQRIKNIQDPAEIPDDLAKQLLVELLAWGICP
jgi:hypothetical protein